MPWLFPAIVSTLSGTILLVVIYAYLYATYRDRYLGIWAASWAVYALRFVATLAMLTWGDSPYLLFASEGATIVSAYLLLLGTALFVANHDQRAWLWAAGLALGWTAVGIHYRFSFLVLTIPSYTVTAAIYVWMGTRILKSELPAGLGKTITAVAMILWGVHKVNYPFLRQADWFAPWGFLLGGIFSFLAALGILLVYFEKTQHELTVSEAHRKKLFAEAPYGIALADPETGIISDCNHAFAAMLRRERGEIIGRQQTDFFLAPATGGEPLETKLRISTGECIDVEARSQLVSDRGRAVIQSFYRDITQRKQAEEALRASEIKYRTLVGSIPQKIFLKGRDLLYVSINENYARDLGILPEEVTGKSDYDFFPRLLADKYRTDDLRIMRAEQSERIEEKYLQNGREIWVQTIKTPVRDHTGQVAGVFGIFMDITDRKQAEEDRLRLASAIEQSGEMVVMTDRGGSIEYVNPAFSRITGYAAEEAVGKTPAMLNSGRQSAEFYRELWDTLTGGRTWRGQFVNRKKDGTLFEEEATISPVKNAAGEITHYVAVKRDVTEQLKIEKQLAQAQKMEAIGTMAGGIAHDFNNILGAISGYTELSLAKTPSDSRLAYYLQQIQTASQRAINLVKQILEFSRQTEKERIPLSLTPLVKEAARMLREIIPATIEIRLNLRAEADTILADATQIYQILMNLCTNAYQAMKEKGGILEILLEGIAVGEDPADELRGLDPGQYVRMTIRDTGEGIDPVIVKRIFDPFFTTKKVGEGTGLGLSVVHGIVRNYGGKITVESRLGEGSSFSVYLPRIREAREESPREAPRPNVRGQGRILLVDDEAMLASLTKEMLEDRGYTVAALTDSVAALEAFRADPDRFDLVITDQTMPEMTGLEFAASITAIRPDIPVILCTGFLDSAIEERTAKAGIRAVAAKPIRMRRLLEMIQDLLAPPALKS